MSHFSVAVFTEPNGKILEQLLAPYDENLTVDRYVEYTKEQLIEKSKKEVLDYATTGYYAEYLKDPDKYKSECQNERHLNYVENEFPLKLNWTDDEHYKDAIKWYEPDQIGENGEVYSTYNPLSKWDWYQIGGRSSGVLMLKKGALSGEYGSRSWANAAQIIPENMVDSALVGDIDFEGMRQLDIKNHEKWWREAEGKDAVVRYFEYGIEKDMAFEQYLERAGLFGTFAVILPDGKWYEKGKMGWWACVSNEESEWGQKYKERFLDTAKPEWTLTIVDCHI